LGWRWGVGAEWWEKKGYTALGFAAHFLPYYPINNLRWHVKIDIESRIKFLKSKPWENKDTVVRVKLNQRYRKSTSEVIENLHHYHAGVHLTFG
jgi:hypothetical protein